MTKVFIILLIVAVLGAVIGFSLTKSSPQSQIPTLPSLKMTSPTSHSEQEPNDSFATATPLTLGLDTQGTLTTGKDVDYYSFTVPAPGKIQITLDKLPKRYEFYVYDPQKDLIAQSARAGFASTISTVIAQNPGKYYFKMFTNYNEPSNYPYTIRVSVIPFTK